MNLIPDGTYDGTVVSARVEHDQAKFPLYVRLNLRLKTPHGFSDCVDRVRIADPKGMGIMLAKMRSIGHMIPRGYSTEDIEAAVAGIPAGTPIRAEVTTKQAVSGVTYNYFFLSQVDSGDAPPPATVEVFEGDEDEILAVASGRY